MALPGTIAYELEGLTQLVSGLNSALEGTHQDGDGHRILKTEAGQLAWDISQALGPRSKEAGDKKIERDAKQFLTTRPAFSNLDAEQQESSVAGFTWLQAGPNFLLGINDEDNQIGASGEAALGYLRAGQRTGPRGRAYLPTGRRGKQKMFKLNRTRITRTAMRAVLKTLQGSVGILRASFAFAAVELLPNKKVPAWLERHFPSRASGRVVFNDAGLNHPTQPYIEFGSTAAGVESNPVIANKISGKVARRKQIIADKIRKVIAGYAYDWRNGRVFRRREAMQEEEDNG